MKKLLVLGGTGRTGKCVIREALNISGKNLAFQVNDFRRNYKNLCL